jgi:hypothetical protein
MPCYFFHMMIGSQEDSQGTEFACLEDAITDAIREGGEFMREAALGGCRVVISDKYGHVFTTVPQPGN